MDINNLIKSSLENYQNGNLHQAMNGLNHIIKIQPNNITAINLLGIISYQLKDYNSAIRYMIKLIKLNPNNAQTYYILAHSMQETGRLDEAVMNYQKALQINPNFTDVYYNLGTVLQDKKRYDEAISYYQKALHFHPTDVGSLYNIGLSLQEKGQFQEAITFYQKALQIDQNLDEAFGRIGLCLQEMGQLDDSISLYRKGIQLNPNNLIALYGLGTALEEKEQLDEAMTYYQKTLQLCPNHAHVYHNLAAILEEKGQFHEAMAYYQKALRINPDDPNAHFSMSLLLLSLGNFEQGWQEYEWRWQVKDFLERSCSHQPGNFSQTIWDGSSFKGSSLLIYSEQGIGDEIMFASCLQDVIERVTPCIVECDTRLMPIFSRSFPKAVCIERIKGPGASLSRLPQTDMVIPLGSLPKFLRTQVKDFPHQSYLIPDADKVHTWRNRLKTLGDGLAVGISWRGGAIPRVRRKRSLSLDRWAELFSLSGVHFINLQYGDCKDELRGTEEKLGITIHDWDDSDPLKDLDNFASLITALDLVISVDNSTVHMAGALGVPVWTLLPFNSDWRWMRNFEDTPWYASMRLFRQNAPGDWDGVLNKVSENLKKLITHKFSSADIVNMPLVSSYKSLCTAETHNERALFEESQTLSGAYDNLQVSKSDIEEKEKSKYAKAWNLDNRVYAQSSPGLKISTVIDFLDFFRAQNVKTILDAGIGSGKLCKKMIGMGFLCHGVDIVDNCLDEDLQSYKDEILTVGTLWNNSLFKENQFDAVVCTDVLEHIPTDYVQKAIDNLYYWARKYIFLQIALFQDYYFGQKVGEPLHLTVQPKPWWDLMLNKFKIIHDTVLRNQDGKEIYAICLIEKAT
jgi:tetratricopeptide (TPR) repeat protein